MKIAVNTRFLLKGKLEGIGWFTFEVMRRLVAMRPDDEFIFYFDRPFEDEFIFAQNVKGIVLSPPARHPFLWWAWFEFALPRAMKRDGIDLLFSPDGYCSLRSKVPSIMVTHDIAHHHFPALVPFLARHYYNYFIPKYLQKATKLITVSEFTKKDVCKTYAIEAEKVTVAHNGCRNIFKPLTAIEKQKIQAQFSDNCPYFFYAGAVHPRKNVHRLIAAFDTFKAEHSSDVKLLIGGRFGWQTGEVKTAFDTAKYKKDIHFLGYMTEEDLPVLMASALALVYVSNFEGFGLPVLEAMASEVPVITSTVSSLPEVAGNAALLVDPEHTAGIQVAMTKLWLQPDLRKELIEKGKKQRLKFDWDKTASVINEVIATKNLHNSPD